MEIACLSLQKLDFPPSLKWCVLPSLNYMYSITMNDPFFPIFFKHFLFSGNFSFSEFANCHMWVELSIRLQLRNSISDNFLDIQKMVSFGLRNKKNSSMREEVHFSEKNIESWEFIEPLLKRVESLLKVWLVDKRKTNIDVRLPSLKGRIVFIS